MKEYSDALELLSSFFSHEQDNHIKKTKSGERQLENHVLEKSRIVNPWNPTSVVPGSYSILFLSMANTAN